MTCPMDGGQVTEQSSIAMRFVAFCLVLASHLDYNRMAILSSGNGHDSKAGEEWGRV
jgi:hypothetical protein